jgi:Glycosyl hydrolases family 6
MRDLERLMSGRPRHALLLAALLLALPLLAAPGALAGAKDPTNPFAGQRQFLNCEDLSSNGQAWDPWWQVHHSHGKKRALLKRIARVPVVKSFAGTPARKIGRRMERYMANVDHPMVGGRDCSKHLHYSARAWARGPIPVERRDPFVGDLPILAIRSMNYSVCKGRGPTASTPYKPSINRFVAQLGRTFSAHVPYHYRDTAPAPGMRWRPYHQREAAVILEPDRLGQVGQGTCLSHGEKIQSLRLMRWAVKRLTSLPNVAVYIDAGEENWLPRRQAAHLLRRAGVGRARGFALNSTHTGTTRKNLRYGNWIAKRLHKHYVVNTAENAHGKLPRRIWSHRSSRIPVPGPQNTNCNPPNAGLGHQPTAHTASSWADAYLWISRPGLSSNSGNRCGRGPTQNVWWMPHALSLARKASFARPAWPPRPL